MTTQTQTLTDFLLARIAEDEAWAVEAINLAVIYDNPKWHWIVSHDDGSRWQPTNATPARVLAECEAKRRIVNAFTHARDEGRRADAANLYLALRALVEIHADHPDFREEWRA